MEIISKINTKNGMEMKIQINGKVIEKTFAYEELDAFVRKERKAEMNKERLNSDSDSVRSNIKRQRR